MSPFLSPLGGWHQVGRVTLPPCIPLVDYPVTFLASSYSACLLILTVRMWSTMTFSFHSLTAVKFWYQACVGLAQCFGKRFSYLFCMGFCMIGNVYSLDVWQDYLMMLFEAGIFFVEKILNYDLGFFSVEWSRLLCSLSDSFLSLNFQKIFWYWLGYCLFL